MELTQEKTVQTRLLAQHLAEELCPVIDNWLFNTTVSTVVCLNGLGRVYVRADKVDQTSLDAFVDGYLTARMAFKNKKSV